MARSKQVRDGFLSDLPEEIQLKVMSIHKLLLDTCEDVWKDKAYDAIRNEEWAKSAIEDFCVQPTTNTEVGSVRVYKQGKHNSCMIQLTGHVINHRNDINHELLHDFFRHVHLDMKSKVRRQFDMKLICESEHGESFEGFDVWTSSKIAKVIWDLFEDKKTKKVKELKESADVTSGIEMMFADMSELPQGLQEVISNINNIIESNIIRENCNLIIETVNDVQLINHADDTYSGKICLSEYTNIDDFNNNYNIYKNIIKECNEVIDSTKKLFVVESANHRSFNIDLNPEYVNKLWSWLESTNHEVFEERSHGKLKSSFRIAKDINTGHPVKIVFDLDPESITHIGNEKSKEVREKLRKEEDQNLIKDIPNTGHNDFCSYGTVKAIIDLETKEKLDSVDAYGFVGKADNKDSARTYKVGEKEEIPSYKSTSSNMWDGTNFDVARKQHQARIDLIGKSYVRNYGNVSKARHLEHLGNPSKQWTKAHAESTDILFDPMMEANNNTPEYNTDMSEKEAKATLRTLSQNMINDMESNKDYKVSQYTANIYANIISKNLLPLWSTGFRKFTITLDSYQSFNTVEFKVPKMTQDFVSRFIQGRETINGFIHRHPEINIKMSPKIFHTMKNPDDAFNFFRSAIKYYNSGLEKYSDKLMVEAMKLNHELKHLIATTKLSGIITCPMQLLFIFDDVTMDNKDTFKISQEDIKTVNQFIRNIYTRYAAPEKEKKQIVDDVREMVKALKESCDNDNENVHALSYLAEAVDDYFFGKFEDIINRHNEKWMTEQFDMDWIRHQKDPKIKYLQEKFGVKKLKKIPSDLVAYITIETEAIKDANDKMMISSYCLSKIEIVEWYIELLEVGSKKYIVPHTKPYLETLRTQLLQCFNNIMKVKIEKPNTRPIIDIQYPKGYEG